jgi:hypothetical protein
MVAEMTKDHSTPQRTQAFLYLQMTYVLGNALSAILGGKKK